MADGSLDEANSIAGKIAAYKATARAALSNILKSKQPDPQVQDIPRKVLEHYIKDLSAKIK
jgi:hypothetical protein